MNLTLPQLHLERLLCVLDLETPGFDPHANSIVEVAFLKLRLIAEPTWLHHVLNPQRAITASTRAVHGIFEEDIVGKPTIQQIARDVHIAS